MNCDFPWLFFIAIRTVSVLAGTSSVRFGVTLKMKCTHFM